MENHAGSFRASQRARLVSNVDWVGAIPVTRGACTASEPLGTLSGRINRSGALRTTFPLPAQEVL
jgi:hypothetical protein